MVRQHSHISSVAWLIAPLRPLHKLVCQESKAAAKFKFVSTLTSNLYLEIILMTAFILTFGLHKNMIVDRPLIVRCDLVIDAEDIPLIFRLASGKQTPEDFPDGVQGMIQIKSFTALDSDVAVDAQRRRIWEEAKKKGHLLGHKSYSSSAKNATGLIDFHMEGTDQVLTFPLHLHNEAVTIAARMAEGKDVVYPVTGQTVHMNTNTDPSIGRTHLSPSHTSVTLQEWQNL